jgi:hypothetical protein
MHTSLRRLLADITRSLDALADDLDADRPELAHALRREARVFQEPSAPNSASVAREPPPRRRRSVEPLLYDALDAGLIGSKSLDRLLIRTRRARKRKVAHR